MKSPLIKHLNHNNYNGYAKSIRQRVFKELDKNPLLTPKNLCKLLDLSYETYRQYVANLKSLWKHNYRNEQGSKCSSHGCRGFCFVSVGLSRTESVQQGWVLTRARNKWLLWKDKLGRLQWFETGRVNLYVRKPANLGKAYQLVCNGFFATGLIFDFRVMKEVLKTVRFKRASYVFETSQRLPKLVIDLFGESNGVRIKLGDRSHPHAVEVDVWYPDWAERNERLFEKVAETLGRLTVPAPSSPVKIDYVV